METLGKAFLTFIAVGWLLIALATVASADTCTTVCWTTPNGTLICETTCDD